MATLALNNYSFNRLVMENFFGIGLANSFYDKRRHVNVIFMIIMDYHFYANPGFAERLVSLLKSGCSEPYRTRMIANDYLTRDELNYLNIVREKYSLPSNDFERICSGLSMYDPQYKTPSGYGSVDNKRLLVDMVMAVYVATNNYASTAFTNITAKIGALAKGMNGISFNQAKFEQLFHLTLKASETYGLVNRLQEIEDYVIARW